MAATGGHCGIIEALIKHHANPHATDKNNRTPLELATAAGHEQAIELLKAIEDMLQRGFPSTAYNAALLDCSRRGDHITVQKLIRMGADIKYSDNDGKTALHYAATSRHVSCAKKLMEYGANPNALDAQKLSPLMYAIDADRNSVVRALLAGGADPLAATIVDAPIVRAIIKNKQESLQVMLDSGVDINWRDSNDNTLLHTALREQKTEIIQILLERGADINVTRNGEPLFLTAIKAGNDECIRTLMHHEGLDYHAKNEQGEGAMHVAAQCGKIEVMVFLAKKAGIALNVKDAAGRTPLHHAAITGRLQVVTQMVNIKFLNVNELDDDKKTPLYYAKREGNTQCAELLREAGGVEDIKDL